MSFSSSPLSEQDRQDALSQYAILDTLPEQDYDELTQLASQICQTPISLITLVDDKRQWFKSAHGLTAQETPKEGGFCTHTVSRPTELSIIEDARISDQFAQHPLVTGDPHIVFYAGAPLVDAQGFALGSICVIDIEPRQLSPAQRSALCILAKQVVNLLTLRKQNRELKQSQEQYQLEKAASADSEARFRILIEEAPVATSLFVGRELRVDVANAPMLSIWGKGPDQIGKTLAQILPEIADQPFLAILDNVYTSGQTFSAKGAQADLVYDGVPGTYYFDFTYKPLFDRTGKVYAILQMAVDVTAQVLARQQLEQQESALRNAVELAELGTWTLDVASGATHLSARHAAMFGLEVTELDYETALAIVHPDDQERVRSAFESALKPGSDGRYQAEYRIINATSNQQQIVRAKGETIPDAQGKPLRIAGTTQDITLERELQTMLEQQVQQRTEELAATNEELAASNEEYAVTNEELEEANSLLIRSNDNLQTFAYIASHDLQEPLRKIQQFGNLLQIRFAGSINEEGVNYLERMQGAASRMSTLMRDLLSFSRISTQRTTDALVNLDQVFGEALEVMDLAVDESGAQMQIYPLPTVPGDAAQLGQLFQNLLANALKFRRLDLAPIITISSQPVRAVDLPGGIKPIRRSTVYHRISVADNGIGFEEKYLNRIFGVFQRLHGKDRYAGTGVGLAICEKVVANHGGVITATSQLGQGATFLVYLPAEV